MTREEISRRLHTWEAAMRECDAQLDALAELLNCNPESPLWASVLRVQDAYTELTAAACGFSQDWLDAWWLEHHFGGTPMKAGLVDEPLRDIETLDDLLSLIFDDADPA